MRSVYGKMECRMEKIEPQVIPVPPNTIASLRAGFDAVANHIVVIIIPLAVDLLLWLGPHMQVKTLTTNLFNLLTSTTAASTVPPDKLLSSSLDMIRTFFAEFNLLSILRTIPVGIPSLMAFKLPTEVPSGSPLFLDITNPFVLIAIIVGLLLAGLIGGSFFYTVISQISLHGRIELKQAIKPWWWSSVQVGWDSTRSRGR